MPADPPAELSPDGRELESFVSSAGAGVARFGPVASAQEGGRLRQAANATLRGGLTTWVHVGMLIRSLRGAREPLEGLGRESTFEALSRLVEAAIEGVAVTPDLSTVLTAQAHVRVFTSSLPPAEVFAGIEHVLHPYTAASSLTGSGRAVIGWFAIRHLIARGSPAFSLQVVHLPPQGGAGVSQVSLMLTREVADQPTVDAVAPPRPAAPYGSRRAALPRSSATDFARPTGGQAGLPGPVGPVGPVGAEPAAGRRGRRAAETPRQTPSDGFSMFEKPAQPSPAEPVTRGQPAATARNLRELWEVRETVSSQRRLERQAHRDAQEDEVRGAERQAEQEAAETDVEGYLGGYGSQLGRELLLEPVEAVGPDVFGWLAEPSSSLGVWKVGTLGGSITGRVVLAMALRAVARLQGGSRRSTAVALSAAPVTEGDLIVQRWALGPPGTSVPHLVSVAARTGGRRRPTQVVIQLIPHGAAAGIDPTSAAAPRRDWSATASATALASATAPAGRPVAAAMAGARPPGRVTMRVPLGTADATGADVPTSELVRLPLWWHSAGARCDGNDVILYEMPFRGLRLRVRGNDYPNEPMYTLLVGDPGVETATLDLSDWPAAWTRPRLF